MGLLHEELRKGREKAGLSQKALANLAGIPRNQVVRAERGENITVDTLRKIVAHLPLTELSLLDTKGFRIDIVAEPEKLYPAAVSART
jgi:transcriptional regulator with XRE-family HTH domain